MYQTTLNNSTFRHFKNIWNELFGPIFQELCEFKSGNLFWDNLFFFFVSPSSLHLMTGWARNVKRLLIFNSSWAGFMCVCVCGGGGGGGGGWIMIPLQCTEHPLCTQYIPLMHSRDPPDVLMVSPDVAPDVLNTHITQGDDVRTRRTVTRPR